MVQGFDEMAVQIVVGRLGVVVRPELSLLAGENEGDVVGDGIFPEFAEKSRSFHFREVPFANDKINGILRNETQRLLGVLNALDGGGTRLLQHRNDGAPQLSLVFNDEHPNVGVHHNAISFDAAPLREISRKVAGTKRLRILPQRIPWSPLILFILTETTEIWQDEGRKGDAGKHRPVAPGPKGFSREEQALELFWTLR